MASGRTDSATYLPCRPGVAESPNRCRRPLLLAWASSGTNHFVPLCRTVADAAVPPPVLPESCRPPGVVPAGESVASYVDCWALNATGFEDLAQGDLFSVLVADPSAASPPAFLQNLLDKGRDAAAAALAALPLAAAAAALGDPDFVAKTTLGEPPRPGMLCAAALVQHAAGRVEIKTTLGVHAADNSPLDVAFAESFAQLQESLPEGHQKALKGVPAQPGGPGCPLAQPISRFRSPRAASSQRALRCIALRRLCGSQSSPAAWTASGCCC